MPSESQASPAAQQAKLSSTTIDRLELGVGSPSSERLSQADEVSSQAISVSVSLNTEAHRMVDDLLGSEAAENESNLADADANDRRGAFLAPALEISAGGKTANDTTYGFDTTMDTSGFVRALQEFPAQKQPQGSPRPHLPSIYNSPFAPRAGEATPRSRPSTAKRMSPPHSRQHSQNAMACPPQVVHSVETTYSSMPDPSSFVSTQTPVLRNAHLFLQNAPQAWNGEFPHYGAIGEPVLRPNRNGGFIDDSEFRSSDVFVGSNWAYSGQSANEALNLHTPPNGQGPS